jgi:hypothetical protein
MDDEKSFMHVHLSVKKIEAPLFADNVLLRLSKAGSNPTNDVS